MSANEASTVADQALNESSKISECRICLDPIKDISKIRNLLEPWSPPWVGMEATVAEDLKKLVNIQVTDLDVVSKVICTTCYEKLKNACDFVNFVKSNNSIIKQRNSLIEIDVSSESVWPKPIQVDTIAGVYNNVMDVEIKQELLSEAEDMETAECQNPFNNIEIKVEPEEIVAQDHTTGNGLGCSNSLSNYNEINGDADAEYFGEEYLESSVKEEPLSEEETEISHLDLSLECLLCCKMFHSISGLKAHVIAHHSYKTVRRRAKNTPSPVKKSRDHNYVCATCRRSFTTSTDLMVHETCHSKMVCYICNQKFDTFNQLSIHRKRCKTYSKTQPPKPKSLDDVKRPPTTELKTEAKPEILTCPLCPEVFTEAYYLKIHQEIHHSNTELNEQKQNEDKSECTKVSLQSLNNSLQNSIEENNGIGIISDVSSTLNVNVEVEKVIDLDNSLVDAKTRSVADTVEASLESIFGIIDSEKTEVGL